MKRLPEITAIQHQGTHAVILSLLVQPELHYFPNHFPDYPLLPGVVQLDWAIHFGRKTLQARGDFCRMDNIKFQAIVQPGQKLDLHLQWHAENGRLEFAYKQDEKTFSSGVVILAVAS